MPCRFLKLYCILTLIVFSCDERSSTYNKEHGDSLAFDSGTYKLANYIERMSTFMNKYSHNMNQSTDYIVVLNTSACSSCVRAQFSDFTKRIGNLMGNFLVVSDDSSFIHSTNDSSISFEILPRDLFERFNVVHRNIYIYSLNKGEIHSSELFTEDTMDSLIHSE